MLQDEFKGSFMFNVRHSNGYQVGYNLNVCEYRIPRPLFSRPAKIGQVSLLMHEKATAVFIRHLCDYTTMITPHEQSSLFVQQQ